MNIAICDDEKVIREQIKERIEELSDEYEIKMYASGEELLSSGAVFDIIFIDSGICRIFIVCIDANHFGYDGGRSSSAFI